MAKHEHRFERLSDTVIFCACGEVKVADPPLCERAHAKPVWVYPYWERWPNTATPTWWPPYRVSDNTTTTDATNTA